MTANSKQNIRTPFFRAAKRFSHSVWLFPAIMLVPLAAFTILRVSGSSIGIYHSFFYGNTRDQNLLLNEPRAIRSDEWVSNSQATIAQKNDNFARINNNVGNGEDVSILLDVPYKEWSIIFKPHDLGFFVMPFDNAFAFRWWLMAYLLIVSCYLFIVSLLPSKRLLAALLSVAFLYSPFVQWWYLYSTMGPIYYGLFGGAVFIKLLGQKSLKKSILWGLLLAYLAICFVLVLYPPFQIACALAMLAFAGGYFIEKMGGGMPRRIVWQKLGIIAGAVLIAGCVTLVFLATRSNVVYAIQNTVYPGKRIVQSGNYDMPHLLSGNMDFQLQFTGKAYHYDIPKLGISNQSEAASFLFLWPFLIVPCLAILAIDYRRRKFNDWPLLFVNLLFLVLLLWLFVPHLNLIGKATLLNLVPQNRLILGLGLLGLIQLVLLMRRSDSLKKKVFSTRNVFAYCLLILFAEVFLDFHAKARFPGFIGNYRALAFALPIPLIIFALLKNRFKAAVLMMLAFSTLMSIGVNPFYKGTAILTATRLSSSIKTVASQNPAGRWVIEDGNLENFASMNGARSLSGVYTYPQLGLWRSIDPQRKQEYIYNRYAHVSINLDRDGAHTNPTSLIFGAADHFGVYTEPCSTFLRTIGVRFALTEVPLAANDRSCTRLLSKVSYPMLTFYIYKID